MRLQSFGFVLMLAGCKVGPDYQTPTLPTPASWSNEAPAFDATATSREWWRVFGDPVLDSLVQRALRSNHDLRIAAARLREVRARYGVAESALLPAVDADASVQRDRVTGDGRAADLSKLLQQDARTTWYAAFDSRWEIDLFGGNRRGVEAAAADVEAAEDDRQAVLVSLLGEVGRAYVDLRSAQKQLAVDRASTHSALETVELTERLRKSEMATELDLARARAQRADIESELPRFEASARQAIHRLAYLLGEPPGALIAELSSEAPIPVAPARVLIGLPSELVLRRPDVRKSERQLAAATARIGVATSDLYPKFSISSALGLEALSFSELAHAQTRLMSFGAGATLPLFDAGRIRSRIREAGASADAALATYEQSYLGALTEVEDALVGYVHDLERHRSLTEAATESRRAAQLARSLFEGGLTTFLDTLDAQRVSYQADGRLAESEARIATRLVQLYKALGGGWDVAVPEMTKSADSHS